MKILIKVTFEILTSLLAACVACIWLAITLLGLIACIILLIPINCIECMLACLNIHTGLSAVKTFLLKFISDEHGRV